MSEDIHPKLKEIVETEGVDIGRIKDEYTAQGIAQDIEQDMKDDPKSWNGDGNKFDNAWERTDRVVKREVAGDVMESELAKSGSHLSTMAQRKVLGELVTSSDGLGLRKVPHLAPAIREGDRVAAQYDDIQRAAEAARSINKD